MAKRRSPIGYLGAIEWLAINEDLTWLDDEIGTISVTAALVADIYGRTEEEVESDLRKMVAKVRGESK